jgi:hypothetical protein
MCELSWQLAFDVYPGRKKKKKQKISTQRRVSAKNEHLGAALVPT